MLHMLCTVYYCGHGAMNYIEVTNEDGIVVLKILIDAGTTQDDIANEAENNFQRMKERLLEPNACGENVLIWICITHYHEDHYSYINRLITELTKYENLIVYLGSVGDSRLRICQNETETFFAKIWNLWQGSIMADTVIRPQLLWQGQNIELYILWNNLCPDSSDYNDNSAAFLVRDTSSFDAFVFLGDMTGTTFLALADLPELMDAVSGLLSGYGQNVTVPHHGSIKTLQQAGFINIDESREACTEAMDPLVQAMHRMGMDNGVYYISNGILDTHKHPDYMTATAFRDMAAKQWVTGVVTGYTTFTYCGGYPKDQWVNIAKNGAMIYSTAYALDAYLWNAACYESQFHKKERNAYAAPASVKMEGVSRFLEKTSCLEIKLDENSFCSLFGPLGSMIFYENGMLREEDVLGAVKLLECGRQQERFQGILDVTDSRLAPYEDILQGVQMKGTYKDGALYADAPVLKWSPGFAYLPFEEQEKAVVFCSWKEQYSGGERQRSEAFLECRGKMGKKLPVPVSIRYHLLQSAQAAETYTAVFGEGKGLLLTDIAAQLPDLLGMEMDLLAYFPSELPFLASMMLYQVSIHNYTNFAKDRQERIQLSVTCGYGQKEWKADSDVFSLEGIRFVISFYDCGGKWKLRYVSVEVGLRFLKQSFAVTAVYPNYLISFSNQTGSRISLAEAAAAFGARVLPGMEQAQISSILYEGKMDFSEFYLRLSLDSVFRARLSEGGTIVWDKLAFSVRHDGCGSCFQIEGAIVFLWNEEELVRFRCAGNLSEQRMLIEGKLLIGSGTFPAIYQAVSGEKLPDSFPEITILSAEVSAEYAEALSLKKYGMEIQVSVSDTSVFGTAFQMKAALLGSGSDFEIKGSFLLEDCFTIYASLSVKKGKTAWKFGMQLARVLLELSYTAEPRRCITGSISSDLTLQDAVSYLLSLLDPTKSYVSSADWKLLDAISLKNTQVVYDYDRQELQLAVCPALSLPFAKVDKLWVTMGGKGISFHMAGQFLGEDYTEEKPLVWDEDGPPATTGDLLHVNYLLFAEGIQAQLPDTVSVEEALCQLEKQIPPEEVPASLIRNPAAGLLGGLDLLVADTVQIQALYDDYKPFYGAAFYLYGEKAGVLKGLRAEISYTRLTDNSGVFSGSIVPPKELRSIRIGAVTLGIGRISASVYTNGNFQIDLGYPAERDYTHSFQLSYGMFEGLGGIYVKKGITKDLALPATDRGYFSPVLAMGIGMRLQLRQDIKAGPLSASASLVMQGAFEGVYATYLPYGNGKTDTYYRADAEISFDGKLQGSVDFGIIGVSVMAAVHAKSRLRIEAYRPAQAEISLYVEAGASVKVLFCKIRFHFALSFGMKFVFDQGGKAPWLQAGGRENVEMLSKGPDALPEKLSFALSGSVPAAAVNTVIDVIAVHGVILHGIADGQYFSVLAGMVSREDFARIVSRIGQTAALNGYLCNTDGEELFCRQRFFRGQDWLYEFLEHYFVLQLDFQAEETGGDGVIMPLPDCMTVTFEEHLTNGDVRSMEWNLWDYFCTGADFRQQMEEYYADTMFVQPDREEAVSAGNEDTASLASQIFADYFELILKAVRAEKENSKRKNCAFDVYGLEDEQLDNIIGMASRFLLGGKRGPVKAGRYAGAENGMRWQRPGKKERLKCRELQECQKSQESQERQKCQELQECRERQECQEYQERQESQESQECQGLRRCQGCQEFQIEGLWSLAGLQIELSKWEQTERYRYKLKLASEAPGWLSLAGNAAEISLDVTTQQAAEQFPAAAFPASIFAGEPVWMEFCQQTEANRLYAERILSVKERNFAYYKTGEGFREDTGYCAAQESGGGNIRFGILVSLTLQKCRNAGAVYRVIGGSDFFLLYTALQQAQDSADFFIEELLFLYRADPTDQAYAAYDGAGCMQLEGRGRRETDSAFCSIEEKVSFAGMLAESGLQGGGNYLCFPDDCPLGKEEVQEVYFAVHLKEGQAYRFFCNCVAAGTDRPSLALQGNQKALRTVLPQGTAGITVTIDESGLTDKEQLLAMEYQNLALEIEDESAHIISHETMPFMQEGSEGKKTCSMAVSYARALEGSQADVYRFVTEQRRLVFRLLWIDIFGNRMPAGKELHFVPKYTDRLIAVHNYPGIDTSFQIRTDNGSRQLAVCFHYGAQLQADTGIWQAARAQIVQKDTELALYSGLLEQTAVLDKERLAGFLNQCIKEPGKEASLTYLADMRKPQNGAEWMDMEAELYLSRNSLYVDPHAPDEAVSVHSVLTFGESTAELQNSYAFAGNGKMLLLAIDHPADNFADNFFIEKEAVYTLHKTSCYAWLRLPVVTGCFAGKDGTIELAAYDLQETYEMFREDFAYVNTPHAFELMCRQEGQPLLEQVYRLRRLAAEAEVQRIRPLSQPEDDPDGKLAAVRRYVKQRLWEEPDKQLQDVLFLSVTGTAAFSETQPKKRWKGQMGGCPDYPVEVGADTASIEAVGGIDASVLAHPEKLFLELDSLWDEKQRSYSPVNGAFSFQKHEIPGLEHVCFPSAGIPQPPVYRRREEPEQGCALVVVLRPLVQDTLYLWYSGKEADSVPEPNEPVCAMYRYAEFSRKISQKTSQKASQKTSQITSQITSQKTSIEGIQAMLPAMEDYVKALGELQERPHDQAPEQKLQFIPEEGQEYWQAVTMAVMDQQLTLECSYGKKDWYVMEQKGARFDFAKDSLPAYGEEIQLKIVYSGKEASGQSWRLCMVREQPAGEVAVNQKFYRWSPEIIL